MAKRASEPDWKAWLASWDRQQESFNRDRERRFTVMLDVLEASLPKRFAALDLGCGPGSLTARLLRRFPQARVVSVDFDPVVLRLGREALTSLRERITWVDANLAKADWTRRLPTRRFDAALSTTALHWLGPAPLRRLYADLRRLLRPGGVFVNGDYLPWDAERPRLRRLGERVRKARVGGRSLRSEWSPWNEWWDRIEKEPALRDEVRERKARASHHPQQTPLSLAFHERALRHARFREVDVVWQDFENRILLGIR